jgi:hypothetical protein
MRPPSFSFVRQASEPPRWIKPLLCSLPDAGESPRASAVKVEASRAWRAAFSQLIASNPFSEILRGYVRPLVEQAEAADAPLSAAASGSGSGSLVTQRLLADAVKPHASLDSFYEALHHVVSLAFQSDPPSRESIASDLGALCLQSEYAYLHARQVLDALSRAHADSTGLVFARMSHDLAAAARIGFGEEAALRLESLLLALTSFPTIATAVAAALKAEPLNASDIGKMHAVFCEPASTPATLRPPISLLRHPNVLRALFVSLFDGSCAARYERDARVQQQHTRLVALAATATALGETSPELAQATESSIALFLKLFANPSMLSVAQQSASELARVFRDCPVVSAGFLVWLESHAELGRLTLSGSGATSLLLHLLSVCASSHPLQLKEIAGAVGTLLARTSHPETRRRLVLLLILLVQLGAHQDALKAVGRGAESGWDASLLKFFLVEMAASVAPDSFSADLQACLRSLLLDDKMRSVWETASRGHASSSAALALLTRAVGQ